MSVPVPTLKNITKIIFLKTIQKLVKKLSLANVTTSSTDMVLVEAILFIEPLALCVEQRVGGESNL